MHLLVISDYRDTQAVRPEAAQMIRLRQAGLALDIITYPDTPYESAFKEAGITVHTNHPHKKYDLSFIRWLRDLTQQRRYDIFYLFNSRAIINGIQAAKKLPVKVILYRGYTGNIYWYDPTAYLKYLHPRVDKIICIAKSIEEWMSRQLFFDQKKMITIHKGHDPAWYQNIKPLDLKEFGIPSGALVMACMANARRFKGIRYLLEATYPLADLPDLYLLLIGRDMTRGKLGSLLKQSPMHERIIATGWRSDVLEILASTDLFVLPSIGGEAITKSLIEAMSMGCAPIITDIAGNRALVQNEQQGLVVPTKDPTAIANAVRKLYQDRSQIKQFALAAKSHIVENFHIDRSVKEMRSLFEHLLHKEMSQSR